MKLFDKEESVKSTPCRLPGGAILFDPEKLPQIGVNYPPGGLTKRDEACYNAWVKICALGRNLHESYKRTGKEK